MPPSRVQVQRPLRLSSYKREAFHDWGSPIAAAAGGPACTTADGGPEGAITDSQGHGAPQPSDHHSQLQISPSAPWVGNASGDVLK